jgi:hypothetical protein
MNVDELTVGDIKHLTAMFNGKQNSLDAEDGLNGMVGKTCIVRTYSAGVWFGVVSEKSGKEVIVKNARRMWRWHAAESISLSAVANHGINVSKSKIIEAVGSVWLESIEIIPCTQKAISIIEGAPNAKAG